MMGEVTVMVILGLWLVPPTVLCLFGGLRHPQNILLWPLYLIVLIIAVVAAFLTEGGFSGLRKFWNHANGRGFQ